MIKRSYTSLVFESSVTSCIGMFSGLMLSRYIISSDNDGYYARMFSITGTILYGLAPLIDYWMKRLDNYLGQDGINPDIE